MVFCRKTGLVRATAPNFGCSANESDTESEMHSRHADYCTFRNISALVTTWNAGASVPNSLQRSGAEDTFFEELARHNDAPDVLVFGFQELVDLEDTKLTASRSQGQAEVRLQLLICDRESF